MFKYGEIDLGANCWLPGAQIKLPGNESELPGTKCWLPEANMQLPNKLPYISTCLQVFERAEAEDRPPELTQEVKLYFVGFNTVSTRVLIRL